MAWRRTGDNPLTEPMLIQFAGGIYAAALWGQHELNKQTYASLSVSTPWTTICVSLFQGIYRLAGVKSKVESLHQQIKSKRRVDLGEHPPVDIAAALKLHLKEVRLRW